MKKYDSYKDSEIEWIGEIPTNWDVKPLFSIASKNKVKNSNLTESNVLSLSYGNIIRRDISDNYGLLPDSFDTYQIVENGMLVLRLTDLQNDKKSLRVGLVKERGVITSAYIGLVFEDVNPIFAYYLFHNYDIQKVFYNFGSGVRQMMSFSDLKRLPIIKPNEEEQTIIAVYLDKKITQIDDLISKKQQFIQLLEEERVAVINQAVTKGIVPNVEMKDSGIEWLGVIPKHWEVKKLKQIFNSSKGLTITKENLESEGIPCVNYGEIHSKFGFEVDIDKHQLKYVNPTYLESDYKSLIQTGDFVFADTSEDVSGAGNFTYLKSNHEIFAGYHTIILRAQVDIESRYFAYQFDSIPYRTQIRQSVKGIKVFSITQGILKNTSLWIPQLNEQKQIIDFLDIETNRIVSLKNSAVKEIELLKEYKTALISEVVTGKVDIRNEILN